MREEKGAFSTLVSTLNKEKAKKNAKTFSTLAKYV
jgi:hypothetical protein